MPIQDPLIGRSLGLCDLGKAKIEVPRLRMGPGKGGGEMELKVKDVEQEAFRPNSAQALREQGCHG